MRDFNQEMLGHSMDDMMVDTNVDIVFCLDATASMEPLIEKVKNLTIGFRKKLEEGLRSNHRKIAGLRAKVIVFRDYYVDEDYALEESKFFILPEETQAFQKYVSNIRVGGGGDEPESALEALAVALRSDFVKEGEKRRHIVVLFTDASAHPYEQQKDGVPDCYPKNMFRSINDLFVAWGTGQGFAEKPAHLSQMDDDAKRLVLFAPSGLYPWNQLPNAMENVLCKEMDKGSGGRDLDLDDVIALVSYSV